MDRCSGLVETKAVICVSLLCWSCASLVQFCCRTKEGAILLHNPGSCVTYPNHFPQLQLLQTGAGVELILNIKTFNCLFHIHKRKPCSGLICCHDFDKNDKTVPFYSEETSVTLWTLEKKWNTTFWQKWFVVVSVWFRLRSKRCCSHNNINRNTGLTRNFSVDCIQ